MEYAAIRFKKPREQFAAAHRDELDAYNAAIRYFKVHLKEKKYSIIYADPPWAYRTYSKNCLLYTSTGRETVKAG